MDNRLIGPDGTLLIPLFHGTSTLFAPDILRHGLGGRSLLAEWGVLEVLAALATLADEKLAADPDWLGCKYTTRRMVEQAGGDGVGMNFRHGTTYVSATRPRAIDYALSNKFGSELLSRTMWLLERLEMVNGPGLDRGKELRRVLSARAVVPAPLVIAVRDVSLDQLRGESGTSAADVLRELELFLEDPEMGFDQLETNVNLSLEVAGWVPSTQLELWVVRNRAGGSPELTLYSEWSGS